MKKLIIIAIALLVILLSSSLYTVNETQVAIKWEMFMYINISPKVFLYLFLLVAFCFYVARDGEGGGGPVWDHFGTILYIFNKNSVRFYFFI